MGEQEERKGVSTMTREEMHEAVNRLFDRLDADGREALGAGICVAHSGPREGVEYTTIEADFDTLHHPQMVTPLMGAARALSLAVDRLAIVTMHDDE